MRFVAQARNIAGSFLVAMLAVLLPGAVVDCAERSPFEERWTDGSDPGEPRIQVQRYEADTYVLRQSVRTHFEAPFLYLLFGTERALLLDTGAGNIEIRPTVTHLIEQWARERHRNAVPLVVAHSHAHGDHIAGDREFRGDANVTVVGTTPAEVAGFFGIRSWPDEIAAFDLGSRVIDVIPAPGHEASHIVIFDRRTRLLLTGDSLLPGRLYFPRSQVAVYRRSIDRIVEFTRTRDVTWILGAHIEMAIFPGTSYAIRTNAHPAERVLELPYSSLLDLQTALHRLGDYPMHERHEDFIIFPRL
jgi:hydroxyacylglutathione hydrolase